MTNLERARMEMEQDAERVARELLKLRRVEAECRRHQRRLPHQVQTALRTDVPEYEIDPPEQGSPGLQLQAR